MSLRPITWAALTAALALCCACGMASASSDLELIVAPSSPDSEAAAEPSLHHGETQLHWQAPSGEYHIIETLANENGFVVLYEERRPYSKEETALYSFVTVQFLNRQGEYESRIPTGIYGPYEAGETVSYRCRLDGDSLYLDMGEDYCRSIDKVTGAVREWHYATLFSENGITLDYSGEYNQQLGMASTRYRLTEADGKARELVVPEFDDNFNMALDFLATGEEHDDRSDMTYTATVLLDAAARTAVVTNTKLTYALNFNDLSYTCTRRYTDEMLEDILATSPDGAVVLYEADSGGAGDAFWQDVVLKRHDGSITFLDFCSVLYGADFFDNNTVVLNDASSLKAFDITAARPAGRPLLDLGSAIDVHGYTHPERLVVGMAVDRENQLLLAAVRDYTEDWDVLLPVTLAVFDASLKRVAELETDCRIRPYGNNWPMPCDIVLNGGGTADLSWYRMQGASTRVRYLS